MLENTSAIDLSVYTAMYKLRRKMSETQSWLSVRVGQPDNSVVPSIGKKSNDPGGGAGEINGSAKNIVIYYIVLSVCMLLYREHT